MIIRKKISLYIPIVVMLVLFAAFITYSFYNAARIKYKADNELAEKQAKAEQLERENDKIAEDINNFQKESFVEKEIRKNFNLKKTGEEVVFIVDNRPNITANNLGTAIEYQKNPKDSTSKYVLNARAWFDYIFKAIL